MTLKIISAIRVIVLYRFISFLEKEKYSNTLYRTRLRNTPTISEDVIPPKISAGSTMAGKSNVSRLKPFWIIIYVSLATNTPSKTTPQNSLPL